MVIVFRYVLLIQLGSEPVSTSCWHGPFPTGHIFSRHLDRRAAQSALFWRMKSDVFNSRRGSPWVVQQYDIQSSLGHGYHGCGAWVKACVKVCLIQGMQGMQGMQSMECKICHGLPWDHVRHAMWPRQNPVLRCAQAITVEQQLQVVGISGPRDGFGKFEKNAPHCTYTEAKDEEISEVSFFRLVRWIKILE